MSEIPALSPSEGATVEGEASMARLLGTSMGSRFMIDTSVKVFEPFLPLIAIGLSTSVVTLGGLLSLRSLMGLLTPLLGMMADRRGYRPVLRMLLLVSAVGIFIVAASDRLWVAALGLIILGIGSSSFIPVLHAYLSTRLPYEQRARGLGIVEYSWALAGIVGVSTAGLLISRYGWRAPFWLLGVGLLLAWLVFGRLPAAPQPVGATTASGGLWQRLRAFITFEHNALSAWATALVNAFNFFATVHVGIAYGAWLLQEYGLGARALGLVGLVVGVAELMGSILVSLGVDRLGKRRAVLLSSVGAALVYAVLPLLNVGLLPAVLSLLLARFTFEVSLVSGITLLSEQVPAERGKVMSLGAALSTLAIALGSLTGPLAYANFGVWGLGPVSLSAALVAIALLWLYVRE